MSPLVRRYLKSAVLFLVTGLVLGVWMLVSREFGAWRPQRLRSAHTHALLVAAGIAQVLGLVLFFWTMWPRIRASGAASGGR